MNNIKIVLLLCDVYITDDKSAGTGNTLLRANVRVLAVVKVNGDQTKEKCTLRCVRVLCGNRISLGTGQISLV